MPQKYMSQCLKECKCIQEMIEMISNLYELVSIY